MENARLNAPRTKPISASPQKTCNNFLGLDGSLVVVSPSHLKNMIVKFDHETPRIGGINIPKMFEKRKNHRFVMQLDQI